MILIFAINEYYSYKYQKEYIRNKKTVVRIGCDSYWSRNDWYQ
jgi:hypothetical protein